MEQQRDYYREVAESLLASNSSYSRHMLSQSRANLLEDAAGGFRRDGRMSSVRRFFCLFCTFDLLFTTLLWLISVMLTGESIYDLWNHEVLGYKVSTSLLDVVGVASLRFSLLLLAYAACHMDHWAVVALTTSGTCTFLIAKVFIFDWTKSPQPVFQVLLVLLSFSLCWGEAWFLDCKVLPQEHLYSGPGPGAPPFLFPVVPGGLGPSDVTSIGDFYSPTESPEGSPRLDRRGHTNKIAAITKTFEEGDLTFTEEQHHTIIKERIQKEKGSKFTRWLRGILHWGDPEPFAPEPVSDEEMVRMGRECEQESLRLLADPGWKKEKDGVLPGDLVEALQHAKYGKIFKLTGVVEVPAEYLYKEMTDGLEQMSSWNPTILECRVLKDVDAHTSLTYQVTTGGPKNAVKPRDFVSVRRCSRTQGRLLSSAVSVEHPDHPPHHQYIRGHNHVGCWSMEVLGERSTRFQWLMACDLKGWLPQYVLDIAFSTAQLDFLAHLRNYAAKKQAEGAF